MFWQLWHEIDLPYVPKNKLGCALIWTWRPPDYARSTKLYQRCTNYLEIFTLAMLLAPGGRSHRDA